MAERDAPYLSKKDLHGLDLLSNLKKSAAPHRQTSRMTSRFWIAFISQLTNRPLSEKTDKTTEGCKCQ